MEPIGRIFVYGTLKRGQCREKSWPAPPLEVRPAWTFGQLFDLGPYPAMLPGQDRILGELWTYRQRELPMVVTVLDRIEITNQPGLANEYDRIDIWATDLDCGQPLAAQTYLFVDAHFLFKHARRVQPTCRLGQQLYATWPK